ncbi:nitronate monooxygenase [Rosenbergiella epipactidis]|uniref:nitronate monooxygenase n=1 Tax=Rosenbergiella epipactidis TaxID=1544694 RepID=UPI001F4E8076|nr:nitronate monooxygenase [Rosenbergiella epipactidis]
MTIRIRRARGDEAELCWRIRNLAIIAQCQACYPLSAIRAWTSEKMPGGYRQAILQALQHAKIPYWVSVTRLSEALYAQQQGCSAIIAQGASAAQLGTALIACQESAASDQLRQRLAMAKGTQITDVISGRPGRRVM